MHVSHVQIVTGHIVVLSVSPIHIRVTENRIPNKEQNRRICWASAQAELFKALVFDYESAQIHCILGHVIFQVNDPGSLPIFRKQYFKFSVHMKNIHRLSLYKNWSIWSSFRKTRVQIVDWYHEYCFNYKLFSYYHSLLVRTISYSLIRYSPKTQIPKRKKNTVTWLLLV